MSSLNLTFPSTQQGRHLLVETDLDQLTDWVNAIPYGRMGDALALVLEKVQHLNRTELNLKEYASLIALFQTPYRVIHDFYYDSSFHHERVNAAHSIPANLKTLSKEMAFAFKKLCTLSTEKKGLLGGSSKKVQAGFFNWALQYLGLILLDHYIGYEHAPSYIWREVYQIYGYAREKSLDTIGLNVNTEDFCLGTVSDTFKRILLIAMSNPYHFEPGELWDVFTYLRHWSILADIHEIDSDIFERYCFIVNLSIDNQPIYAKSNYDIPKDQTILLMRTQRLTDKLKLQLDALENHNQLPQPGFHSSFKVNSARKILHQISHRWDRQIERKHVRNPLQKQIDFVWGLDTITRMLSHFDTLNASSTTLMPNIDENPKDNQKNLSGAFRRWETINASKNGLCIHHVKSALNGLEVGQITMYREYIHGEPSNRWDLAVVKWLKEVPRRGTDIGLELIKGHPQPIILMPNFNNPKTLSSQPAILVSGEEIHGMFAPTIIAGPKIHYEGRQIKMEVGSEQFIIAAQMRAVTTNHFVRFFYQTVEQLDIKAPSIQSSSLFPEDADKDGRSTKDNGEHIILDDTYRLDDFD